MNFLLGLFGGLQLPSGLGAPSNAGAASGPFTFTPQHPDWCAEAGCKPPKQQ